jgi:hypothetical protein
VYPDPARVSICLLRDNVVTGPATATLPDACEFFTMHLFAKTVQPVEVAP